MTVTGYALSGGGRGIERVDISTDGGKTWFGAVRYQKEGVPYVAGDISSDKWAWVLFKTVIDVKGDTEVIVKAVCYLPSSSYLQLNVVFSVPFYTLAAGLFILINVLNPVAQTMQVDSSANVQPESVETIWNLRGILNTCWHRVRLLTIHNLRSLL